MAPRTSRSHNAKKEGKAANNKTTKKVRFAADTKKNDTSQVSAHGSTKITIDLEAELVPRALSREALQSQGWDAKQIPTGFGNNVLVAGHCTLPSPLAEKPIQRRELLTMGSNYARINISQSLSHITSVRDDFRTLFTSSDALLSDGSRARLLTVSKYLVTSETKARSFGWTEKSPPLKRIPIKLMGADHNDLNAGKTFELRRILNSDSSYGYFVRNIDLEMLTVNEIPVGFRTACGPLPDFSIITIGRLVVLFWRIRAALSYVPRSEEVKPKAQAKPRSRVKTAVDVQEQTDWQTVLDHGLNYWRPICEENRAKNANRGPNEPNKQPTLINVLDDWAEDDVILGIASLWEGLRQKRHLFAYAGLDVFTASGGEIGQYGVVGGREVFIMPLLLPSENQDRAIKNYQPANEVGHLVLGVAKIQDSQEDDDVIKVQVMVYDSAPQVTNKDRVRGQVQVLVDQWLGADSKHALSFSSKHVPEQEEGNTCGFHTVLSAWAVMLGIPIYVSPQRRATRANADFYQQGLELVNLALAGCMDSRTIQAFLNVHRFSVAQNPDSEDDHAVRMNTSRMDSIKFNDCLQDQRDLDLVAASEFEPDITEEERSHLRELVGDEPSAEDLDTALIINAGDRDKAAHHIWNPPRTPSPPPRLGPLLHF